MLKNITRLELEIAGKDYHFSCDNDSPLPHVKDALFQFVKYCGQVEDQIQANQAAAEAKKAAEAPKEDSKVEPIPEVENV